MVFDTIHNGYFIHYCSILLIAAAMILMNILIVIIKKIYYYVRKVFIMKICTNCGTENVEEAIVCVNCSALLNNQQQQFNDQDEQFNSQNQQFNPGNIQGNSSPPRNKKSKKIWGFSIAGILGIVAIVVVLNVMGIFMSPEQKLVAVLRRNLYLNNMDGSFKISLKGTPNNDFPEILNNISLKGYLSKEEKDSYSEFTVALNNTNLVNCVISQQDKNLFFAIGQKSLCINVEKIFKDNLNTPSYSNLTKYLSHIDLNKLFSKKYDKALSQAFKGKIVKNNNKYVISLTANDIFNITDKIVDVALEDDNIYNEFYEILKNININAKKDKVDLGSGFEEFISMPKKDAISEMKRCVGLLKEWMNSLGAKTKISDLEKYGFRCEFIIDIGLMNKVKTIDTSIGSKDLKVMINVDSSKAVKKRKFDKKSSVIIEDIEKDDDKIKSYLTNAVLEFLSNEKAIAEIDKEGILDGLGGFGMDAKDLIKILTENLIEDLKDRL